MHPRRQLVMATLGALAVSCSGGSEEPTGPMPPTRPEPLAPLPPPASARSDQFAHSQLCAQCHLATDESVALRDAMGRDVSPLGLWRPSMMALAARDPFFLAAWNEERSRFPDNVEAIDATCGRCHAPMGAVASEGTLTFEGLVSGDSEAARLGRDGVSCSLCHQIAPDNLGQRASFSGGFAIGDARIIYGPHADPETNPMKQFVDYTPTEADHVVESELCATCHTVIVEPLARDGTPRGFELTEQATYFEWLNSAFAVAGSEQDLSCADCHLPTSDLDDNPIRAPIATFPGNLGSRDPFGRHVFVGGGAGMSRLLDANQAWAGLGFDNGELEATAAASEAHLATAAELTVGAAARSGTTVTVAITVENRAGHKLPTGYPTRRMWLHFVARNGAGAVVFESGAPDSSGSPPGDDPATVRSHISRVTRASDVVVWEAVLVDESDKPTPRPLAAVRYAKDTRILPSGFSSSHPEIDRMRPIGAEDDADFVPGSDTVTYEFEASEALTIEVGLMYQSLPAHVAAAHEEWPTPAGVRFAEMIAARPPLPISIAAATATVD